MIVAGGAERELSRRLSTELPLIARAELATEAEGLAAVVHLVALAVDVPIRMPRADARGATVVRRPRPRSFDVPTRRRYRAIARATTTRWISLVPS